MADRSRIAVKVGDEVTVPVRSRGVAFEVRGTVVSTMDLAENGLVLTIQDIVGDLWQTPANAVVITRRAA